MGFGIYDLGFTIWDLAPSKKIYLSYISDLDIYIILTTLSDDMKKEVEDFVNYLQSKKITEEKFTAQRKPGLAKGLIKMKAGFDAPLDDFKEYME